MPRAGIFGSARVVAGGGSLTGTFLQAATDSTDLTTYTFASQNFGTASADRVIAVVVGARSGSTRTITSVTIGGVTATEAVQFGSTSNPTGIYYAAVPTGTTGSVVVTYSGAMLRAGIGAWSITGGVASTTGASGTTSAGVTGTAGGFIIAGTACTNASAFAWTNATEQFDTTVETYTISGAHATTVGATTVSTDGGSGTTPILAVAAFSV